MDTINTAQDSCLRMGMAMMAADPSSALDTRQRARFLAQLTHEGPLPPIDREAILRRLLAYADVRSGRLGATLRDVCGVTAHEAPTGMAGLDILRAYPGQTTREQAEALQAAATVSEEQPARVPLEGG